MIDRDARRRALVNDVFGEVIPATTNDERDDDSSQADVERERWLRDNKPPHHD